MTLVAGVDSSTQGCKVDIVDSDTGSAVRSGRAPHASGTEIDPEVWWQALQSAVGDAGGLADVAALSVGAQQHGMILLDQAGRVIRPALLWNDTRSGAAAAALTEEVGAAELARRTGLVPVASFTIAKVRWVRDAEPDHAARVAAIALPHDWLTWRLRGFGPAATSHRGPMLEELTTDRSDASGTGYWNPATGDYDLDLFELALGRPAVEASTRAGLRSSRGTAGGSTVILPRVLEPDEVAGTISSEALPRAGIRNRIVLGPGAGDNAAAALGLGAVRGDVIVSVGTSGTVFAVADTPSTDESGTVAGFADASGKFLPLVATLNAARVLSTVAELLGVDLDVLAELALKAAPGAGGVVVIPYFEGERTPNLPDAKASFHGLSIASATRANVARAAVEGMLCGLVEGLDAVRSVGVETRRVILIGGAVQNAAVQMIAAQVFNISVVTPEPGEYVARGAAFQAAWALSGTAPHWVMNAVATPEPDFRRLIREQYRAACALLTTTRSGLT
jgi:xylulokinase